MANSICHTEFVSHNMEQSQKFFAEIFGWTFTPMGEEYALWSAGEGEPSGALRLEKPGEAELAASTIVYIEVEDIEATLKSIETGGGKTVCPKTLISEEHGYFALFTDPSGGSIGLWSKS